MEDRDISLVIISRNRERFLGRLFRYLASSGFRGDVFLGDASAGVDRDKVASLVDQHTKQLRLNATAYDATTTPIVRLRSEFDKVRTSLCAWVGDDDFLIPDALRAGARALQATPGSLAVVGRAMLFETADASPWGLVKSLGDYRQSDYASDTAEQRLAAFLRFPSALTYALRRTELTQRILQDVSSLDLPDDVIGYYFFELVDALINVIFGKVLWIDRLMLARQTHPASTAVSGGLHDRWLEFLSGEEWSTIKKRVVGVLTVALHEAQADLRNNAEGRANEAIWRCVHRTLGKTMARNEPAALETPTSAIRRHLKHAAPRIARTVSRWKFARRLQFKDRHELRALLRFVEKVPENSSRSGPARIQGEQT